MVFDEELKGGNGWHKPLFIFLVLLQLSWKRGFEDSSSNPFKIINSFGDDPHFYT
jgi:hypothetical protein